MSVSVLGGNSPLATMASSSEGREAGRVELEHGTPFFLSYAHADGESENPGAARFSNQMAERFYYELMEDVAQLISLPTGSDVGFMDVEMRAGMHWSPELIRAVGSCQVLVALLSAPYVSRDWCGMEWHAFTQRKVEPLPGAKRSLHQGCIIPVRWAPVHFALPKAVKEEQIFSPKSRPQPDLPEQYRQNGIFGLLRMGEEDSYHVIVWQLAMLINELYRCQHVRPRRFRRADLKNIFQDGAL